MKADGGLPLKIAQEVERYLNSRKKPSENYVSSRRYPNYKKKCIKSVFLMGIFLSAYYELKLTC